MFILFSITLTLFLLFVYLRHVNNGMKQVPADAIKLSPHRFTDQQVRDAYKKVTANPPDWTPHLPPKLDRRYVVVGGSGLVGGFIVLHLLARGQPPSSIRIIDFRPPYRQDMIQGPAKDVQFVQADITNIGSIKAAFAQPWPKNVASLPLTVFHTAAAIRPGERARIFLNRCAIVNVNGTANVIAAARAAGADVLVATSSASISIRPVNFWIAPWQNVPKRFVQIYRDPEKDVNLRPHGEYFSNYAWTKARAEDLVLKADGGEMRTGCIRPACVVYGNKYDISFGRFMPLGHVETWIPHIIQNWVHAENISLSHMLYESALLSPHSSKVSGRTYVITDPNAPPSFGDMYKVSTLCIRIKVNHIPSIVILIMAYAVELYCLTLARFPVLERLGLKEPTGQITMLQPGTVVSASVFQLADDGPARKSVEEGGLGYKGVCTTLDGMVNQCRLFNLEYGRKPSWE